MARPMAVASVILVGIAPWRRRRPAPPVAVGDAGLSAAAGASEDAVTLAAVEAVSTPSSEISRAASMMARARWGHPAVAPEAADLPGMTPARPQFGPMVFGTPVTAPKPQFGPMVFGSTLTAPKPQFGPWVLSTAMPAAPAALFDAGLLGSEFVPVRVDVDIDGLRADLTDIAHDWLGADEAAAVAEVIAATRPGVDDFVSTIASITEMELLGRASPLVRAMTREMHYHATEVLCGV